MKRKILTPISFFLIAHCILPTISFAQYTKLFDFTGTNGSYPYGSLISDSTFLYGMTTWGGTNNMGTIFKVKPNGTGDTVLLNFSGLVNGSYPFGSLISDSTFLYGMSSSGGINNMGTIFKIKRDGTGYTDLLDFTGSLGGSYPKGSLLYDGIFLYGMTSVGGTNDGGVIFKIKPDGTSYVKLLDFANDTIHGYSPFGSLIFDGTYLYGMTYYGGTNDNGVVFKINSNGAGYSKLLDFTGVANGSNPTSSLISDGTYLYGMTYYGGTNDSGVVFKIKTDGTGYSKLLDFTGVTNGNNPASSLISNGTYLYGMTEHGGTYNDGTMFKIKPNGTGYSKLFDFSISSTDGVEPYCSLISDGTFLYGMTSAGGTDSDGVIFKYAIETGIVENNPETDLTIYPNPSSGKFVINHSSLVIQQVEIYNILGEKIYRLPTCPVPKVGITVNLSSQPVGIYFISLKTESGVVNQKFVLSR